MADFGELGSTELAEVSRAVGDDFDNLVVDVLCKFHSTLCPAGEADAAALTRECY